MNILKEQAEALLAWVENQLQGEVAKAAPVYRYNLDHCASVCRRLIAGDVGIPAHYEKGDPTVPLWMIDSVEHDRTSVLNVLTIAALLAAIEDDPTGIERGRDWFGLLLRSFGRGDAATRAVPPGLVPDRWSEKLDAGATKPFLEEKLRATMEVLDASHYSDLSGLAPKYYNPVDAASLAAWSLAWSEAVASTYSDWLSNKGTLGIKEVLHDLMHPGTTRYRPNTSTAGQGPLPTSNRKLRIELWASPLHLHVLSHDDARDVNAEFDIHRISFNEIAERRSGTNAYEEGAIKVYRTGLSVQHITAVIWLGRLAPRLASYQSKNSPIMPTLPPCVLPANLERDLAIGQRATVANLVERIDNPGAFKRRGAGSYFAAPPSTTERLTGVGRPEAASRRDAEPVRSPVFPLSEKSLHAVSVIPEDPDLHSVGSVRLAWEVLHQQGEGQWMDIAFVLRYAGTWHPVPVVIEEDGDDEDRVWLSVHPAIAQPWGIASLRRAFASAIWVGLVSGLGVFVAGGLDLDASNQLATSLESGEPKESGGTSYDA